MYNHIQIVPTVFFKPETSAIISAKTDFQQQETRRQLVKIRVKFMINNNSACPCFIFINFK